MPNLLKYFDIIISQNNLKHEKELIHLLADYLISFKGLLNIDENYLNQLNRIEKETSDCPNFLDVTMQSKNLTQIVRCLESKQNEGIFT